MGVNWSQGLMRWMPFTEANGRQYPLNHLHPFRFNLQLSETVNVEIRVAFAMHCFTRSCADGEDPAQFYKDARETRAFCPDRYALSSRLPAIARELATRKCGFAKDENYVTIDVQAEAGETTRYGVFFNVRQVKDADGPAVLLTIQSAYELAPNKQLPTRGDIKFKTLIGLILKGVKPRPPRN